MNKKLEELKKIDKEIQLLTHTLSLLGWDRETYMPPVAVEERAGQEALLSGSIHDRLTSERTGKLLVDLGVTQDNFQGDPSLTTMERAFLRKFSKGYFREIKLPKSLVVEFSKEASLSQAAWTEARKKSDFKIFAPHLEKILQLTGQKAQAIGYSDHPYDALLDEFEPFATTASIKETFAKLKPGITSLLKEITTARQVDESFLLKKYPQDKQEEFGRMVLGDLGFDFERGRLDISAHPFTTNPGSDDVRLTTRYQEDYFKTGIFGIIHECGHGLYELGFSEKIKGTTLAEGTSLGIHESQSRTWENIIGRSLPFWTYYFPKLKKMFPDQLEGVGLEEFYRGINLVEPSLIRVEADEVTYSLHIILRFELELALVSGDLKVKDLPEAWNRKSEELLGIRPSNDAEGVLQDVHWSFGAIGYFPTYTLGNLYGSQFWAKLDKDTKGAHTLIEKGNFQTILKWLRENIHQHGSIYTADELCRKITGESLNPDFFMDYLRQKYADIYSLGVS